MRSQLRLPLPWVFSGAAAAFGSGRKGTRAAACVRSGGRPAQRAAVRARRSYLLGYSVDLSSSPCLCVFWIITAAVKPGVLRVQVSKVRVPRLDFPVVGFPQTVRTMLSPCRRYIVGLFLVAVVQVQYRPAQCSSLFKYLSSEYNLSQVSTRLYILCDEL